MNQNSHYDHDDNASANGFRVAAIGAFVVLLVVLAIALLVSAANAQTIHLPYVAQRCNPCSHSIPYPTPTATPFINEPPVPTEAK